MRPHRHIRLGLKQSRVFVAAAPHPSRWEEEDTSSPGSLVLELLLACPIHLPVVTLAPGSRPTPLPSRPPSKHTLSSFSSTIPPLPNLATRECVSAYVCVCECVALKQALLIEHLFRHGARSVACGRAAAGSSRGDIMSYYISWYVLFTCVRSCPLLRTPCPTVSVLLSVHAAADDEAPPPPFFPPVCWWYRWNDVAGCRGRFQGAHHFSHRQIFWQRDFIKQACQTDTEASFQIITTHLF